MGTAQLALGLVRVSNELRECFLFRDSSMAMEKFESDSPLT